MSYLPDTDVLLKEHDIGKLIYSKTCVNQPLINGPRLKKTYLRGFGQSEFQTGLLSYTDYLEIWNFICSKPRYDTFQK